MKFKAKVISSSKEKQEIKIEAEDRVAAISDLRSHGFLIRELFEIIDADPEELINHEPLLKKSVIFENLEIVKITHKLIAFLKQNWAIHAIVALIFVFFVLDIYGGPKNKVVPTDIAKWDTELKPSIEKLAEEDKNLFMGFVMRAKLGEVFGGNGLEEGLTIGDAIKQQKAWVKKQELNEAESKLLKQKLGVERAALLEQVDDLLTVTVIKLQLVMESEYTKNIIMEFGFKNKGQNDISGIKGSITFIDIFGKEVYSMSFGYDDGLKAGASVTWKGSHHYNQFLESDVILANLEEGKYTTRFNPEMIVFSDGTKLVIKD